MSVIYWLAPRPGGGAWLTNATGGKLDTFNDRATVTLYPASGTIHVGSVVDNSTDHGSVKIVFDNSVGVWMQVGDGSLATKSVAPLIITSTSSPVPFTVFPPCRYSISSTTGVVEATVIAYPNGSVDVSYSVGNWLFTIPSTFVSTPAEAGGLFMFSNEGPPTLSISDPAHQITMALKDGINIPVNSPLNMENNAVYDFITSEVKPNGPFVAPAVPQFEEPIPEEPPANEPPPGEPPAEEPPANEPPANEPPSEEPPADEPPSEEPPSEEPPSKEPVEQPLNEPWYKSGWFIAIVVIGGILLLLVPVIIFGTSGKKTTKK